MSEGRPRAKRGLGVDQVTLVVVSLVALVLGAGSVASGLVFGDLRDYPGPSLVATVFVATGLVGLVAAWRPRWAWVVVLAVAVVLAAVFRAIPDPGALGPGPGMVAILVPALLLLPIPLLAVVGVRRA